MKKLFSLLLVITIIIASVSSAINVFAASEVSGIYTYTVNNNEVTITKVNTSVTGEIEIPATIKDYPVTAIGNEAFYLSKTTGVTVPEGVKSIGSSAFYYCDKMTYIHLPQSLETINESAFYNCKVLTTVTLPSKLKAISSRLFRDCHALESINIPSSVTRIGDEAFYNCRKLKSVTVPAAVEEIGSSAFFFCESLEAINLSNGLKTIGAMAFAWTKIKSLTVPASVTSLDSSFVSPCDYLETLSVALGNARYYSSNNCIIENYSQTLLTTANIREIVIPNGVKSILGISVSDQSKITSIVIPKSVTTIYGYAFNYFKNPTTIYYTGSAADWGNITIKAGNDALSKATIVYNHVMPYTPGDINDSGNVDLSDVVALAQKVAGWSVSCNEAALNVDGAGTVNLDDVVCLAQFVAGWSVILH